MTFDPPHGVAVTHSPARAIGGLLILIATAALALHTAMAPGTGTFGIVIGGIVFLTATSWTAALFFQSVRGIPFVEAAEQGILVRNPFGCVLIPWSAIEAITPSTSVFACPWLRIRLREGAYPNGSACARFASASLQAPRTISVPMFTTFRSAADLAEDLLKIRLQFGDSGGDCSTTPTTG